MGTRIHVYLSHDLPRLDDVSTTIVRLNEALPEAFGVRDYWRSIDSRAEDVEHWELEPISPRDSNRRRYSGPGSLYVSVTSRAAMISTGGRWRGFLSIEPLRTVHLAAFRTIARALGSAKLVLCADSQDAVFDLFLANGSQDDCIAQLRSAIGAPQPSLESIEEEVIIRSEHCVPDVWFIDDRLALPHRI